MSIFKKVLDQIVVFDETKEPTQPTPPPAAVQPAKDWKPGATQVMTYDATMLDQLNAVIVGRKSAYNTLLESSQKLASLIPDETTRIKAAFATLDGRSFVDISSAIDVHVSDLELQRNRFKQTTEQQVAQRVGSLRQTAAKCATTIEACNRRLAEITQEAERLQQQIAEAKAQGAQAESDANAAEVEIRNVEARFNATVDYAVKDLTFKKQNLSTVLVS